MIGKALRRAATSSKVMIVAALLFCVGLVGGTFADFTAEDDSTTATYAGGWVATPSTSSTVPANAGGDVVVVWTHATTGGGNSQSVYGHDEGTTSTACSSSQSFTTVGTGIASTANTYTDTSDTTGSTYNGHYYCYEIGDVYLAGTSTTLWTTPTVIATPILRGLVPTGLSFANHATSGTLTNSDTLTVTYSAPITYGGGGTVTVMACTNGNIVLAAASHSCTTGGIGVIGGLGVTSTRTYTASTVTTPSSTTLVVTIGGTSTTSGTAVSGTGTYTSGTATATLKSTTTPSIAPCTTSLCNPKSSGSF